MDYAIMLGFDPKTDRMIRDWIDIIARQTGNDIALLSGLRPHLTLAEFDSDQIEIVKMTLTDRTETVLRPIQISLASAGFFPHNPSVLYLAPIVDEYLLDLHRLLNQSLEPLCTDFSPLYREENWVPHCTVALELDRVSFLEACQVLFAVFQPIQAAARTISLVSCCPYCEQVVYPLGMQAKTPSSD
jgi:2'-5' RNA ligase